MSIQITYHLQLFEKCVILNTKLRDFKGTEAGSGCLESEQVKNKYFMV